MRSGLVSVLALGCAGAPSPIAIEPAPIAFSCPAADPYEGIDPAACLEGAAREAVAPLEALLEAEHFAPPHTRDAFVALFAADAQGYTLARRERPEEPDLALDATEAAAYFEFERQELPDLEPPHVSLSALGGSIDGDRADVHATVVFMWGSGEDQYGYEYRASTVRTAGGWRIHAVRAWPTYWVTHDRGERYSDAHWDEQDRHATAAREMLAASDTIENRRSLRSRLSAAARWREAHEVAVRITEAEGANADDFWFRRRIARRLGDAADARASFERMKTAPLGPIEPVAEGFFGCHASIVEEEEEQPARERCHARVVLRIEEASSTPRGVAIVEISGRGRARPIYHLVVGHEGSWRIAQFLSDGPSSASEPSDEPSDTLSFEVSDLALRDLVAGGAREAIFRSTTRVIEEGVEIEETGFAACIDLVSESPRCAFVPESVIRRSRGRTTRARATVAFGDGVFEVTGLTGRDPRLRAGSHPLESLFPGE
jgi:hypothetical protein